MIDPGRLSAVLMRWAKVVAPASCRDWIEAMASELQSVRGGRAALSWSFGSLMVAVWWGMASNWAYLASLLAVALGTPYLATSAFVLVGRSGLSDPTLVALTPFVVGVLLAGLVGAYRPDRVLASTVILLVANYPGMVALAQYGVSLFSPDQASLRTPLWLAGAALILLPSLVGPLLGATVRRRVGRA